MRGELGPDGLVGADGLRLALGPAERDEVDQHPAALDVGEKLVAEAHAGGGALDQAGDVGQHELALAVVDRAEDRLERRERVIGDLRSGAGEPGEERGLAGVRKAHEASVGKQLQPQLDPTGFPLEPALREPRRLARGGGEALVAVSPGAARRDHRTLACGDQVIAAPLEPLHLGPGRDRHDDVVAASAVALAALPTSASPGALVRRVAQRREVAARRIALEDDVAAPAAVAAVGPAARHVGLAAEGDGAVATGARLDLDLCAVVEHRMKARRVEFLGGASEGMLAPV